MIKKLLFVAAILYTSAYSATNEQIIQYFKAQIPIPAIHIEVTSRIKINSLKDMDYVSLDINDGSRIQKVSVFTRDDLIFPDVISISAGGSIKQNLDKQKVISQLAKVYKLEDQKNIINIGNDPKKETLVMFSDPECPFCRKELDNIEEKIKIYNLKLIFTPVHERSSLEKSALIYDQTKNIDNTEEKIKILRKYFSGDVDEKVSEAEVAKIETLRQKYFHAGLQGVPFYVSEKNLLN
jgi:thiol:disulfide interchange protein DsbC